MTALDPQSSVPHADAQQASSGPAPRRLFLTLFLRGRGSRGLRKEATPKTVGQKLALTLTFYALLGLLALMFIRRPIFALAIYLHGMTFVFLGMFIASSSGEVLFNNQEADILLHRPISARSLLWAKVRVLIEVSLWLAGAFNLVGFFVGLSSPGGWLFPLVHAVSISMEALFTTGCVVLVYQFCLRRFGREKLEGLMTTAQIIVSIAAVLAGQLLPQLMFRLDKVVDFTACTWWIGLFPPAWFAGFDDALSGSSVKSSWLLAALAVLATAMVLLLAFGKLAGDYESGLQKLSQSASRRALKPGRRRFIDILVDAPPLSWWLRDSVAKASFLLTAAYIIRDRDVKLRLYPSMAPYLVLPIIFFARNATANQGSSPSFGVVFTAAYLAVIPMMAMNLLRYSAQWQASDIFRAAPILGPASICHGTRRAILCLVALPGALAMGLIVFFLSHGDFSQLLLLLPGLILIPVFAMIPNLGGGGVLLSLPNEESRAAGRGLLMVGALLGSMALSGVAFLARLSVFFDGLFLQKPHWPRQLIF